MKAILQSIKPEYCELIASGAKTIEVRKTIPKLETPYKVYIYETKGKTEIPTFIDEEGHEIYQGRGQVIGEYICKDVSEYRKDETLVGYYRYDISYDDLRTMCLTELEINNYGRGKTLYGMHISDLVIYDKPKELRDFMKPCVRSNDWEHLPLKCDGCEELIYAFGCGRTLLRPPQSWCYVEEFEI